MPHTVFFSWQADTATKTGRNLIERASERAASRIGGDTSIEDAIRDLSVDRDTKDVAGSPPIVDTIFQKIDKAAVFLPDLTFVGRRLDGRPAPNPNVLIEYGWALKSLGHGRIVPVMNTAFGEPSQDAMPFNLRHLRNPILYHCPPDADDDQRKRARERLASQLEDAFRAVLSSEDSRKRGDTPPARPFPERAPQDGRGKFRAGQPLGVKDHPWHPDDILLSDGPVTWLRVMPAQDPERTWLVSELKKLATANDTMLLPFTTQWPGFDHLRSADGFGIYAVSGPSAQRTHAIAFVFTTGEIWSVDSYLLANMVNDREKFVPDVEGYFPRTLDHYAKVLMQLGCKPPFHWIAGMEDLQDRNLYVRGPAGFFAVRGSRQRCLEDVIVADGLHVPGDSALSSLRPFFSKLYDACGAEWVETPQAQR